MIKATFFGTPQLTVNSGKSLSAITGRSLALCAYLIVTGKKQDRGVLGDLLWSGVDEQEAKSNLRYVLYRLRRSCGHYIISTRQTVAFAADLPSWCDATVLRTSLVSQQLSADSSLLSSVIDLYQGEFLEGFVIQDSYQFDEWVSTQRQQFHTLVIEGLHTLAELHWAQKTAEAGLATTQRWLALAPWDEEAHRRQMRFFALMGQRSAALAHYDRCVQLLERELDVPPMPETEALYGAIKSGAWFQQNGISSLHDREPSVVMQPVQTQVANVHPSAVLPDQKQAENRHPTTEIANKISDTNSSQRVASTTQPSGGSTDVAAFSPLIDLGTMPRVEHVYGRDKELAQLRNWLRDEECRSVVLLGIGGQGKTTLAAKLVDTLVEKRDSDLVFGADSPVDCIIWRSLINTPFPVDFLHSLLLQFGVDLRQFQSAMDAASAEDGQAPTSLAAAPQTLDFDHQLGILMNQFRQHRCLLVIDNVESILQAGTSAGQYRPGFEGYGQLFQAFAQCDHQSTMLLTSREEPEVFSRLEEKSGHYCTLSLEGLSTAAACQLFAAYNTVTSDEALAPLVSALSGNPYSLKHTLAIIDEIFQGDIAAYLRQETIFIEGIRATLEQQLQRLSVLERDIVVTLAAEQQPLSNDTLLARWMHSPHQRNYLDAMRSLNRRSLLYRQEQAVVLPMIMHNYLNIQNVPPTCA